MTDRPLGTAVHVKRVEGWVGEAHLFRLTPPLDGNEYVIVSAVNVSGGGPETYIFPCNEEGKEVDFLELPGSFKGELDHAKAVNNAGYGILM